jgi:hypothetical protein
MVLICHRDRQRTVKNDLALEIPEKLMVNIVSDLWAAGGCREQARA